MIPFFTGPFGKARQVKRLEKLLAIHHAVAPPTELQQRIPRHIKWKPALKWRMGFHIVMLAVASVFCGYLVWITTGYFAETRNDMQRARQKLEKKPQAERGPEKREEIKRIIREAKQSETAWKSLQVSLLGAGLLGFIRMASNFAMFWFRDVRPTPRLLRDGELVCATVTNCRKVLWILPAVNFEFRNLRGELVQKTQYMGATEYRAFSAGNQVWVLYLTERPKRAKIYGLLNAYFEVIPAVTDFAAKTCRQ